MPIPLDDADFDSEESDAVGRFLVQFVQLEEELAAVISAAYARPERRSDFEEAVVRPMQVTRRIQLYKRLAKGIDGDLKQTLIEMDRARQIRNAVGHTTPAIEIVRWRNDDIIDLDQFDLTKYYSYGQQDRIQVRDLSIEAERVRSVRSKVLSVLRELESDDWQ